MKINYIHVFGIQVWEDSAYAVFTWILLMVGLISLAWYSESKSKK